MVKRGTTCSICPVSGSNRDSRSHFVVEQLDAQRQLVRLRRVNVDHLAAHAEGSALEGLIVAGILQLRQPAQNGSLIDDHALGQVQHHLQVKIRIAQAVDRRHRRHHHHVAPFQQRLGGRKTHLLDVLVHRSVFSMKVSELGT